MIAKISKSQGKAVRKIHKPLKPKAGKCQAPLILRLKIIKLARNMVKRKAKIIPNT